jgi:hypothetical protein
MLDAAVSSRIQATTTVGIMKLLRKSLPVAQSPVANEIKFRVISPPEVAAPQIRSAAIKQG